MCLYKDCVKCKERHYNYSPILSYSNSIENKKRIMFIGQDPTITDRQNRVTIALMLNNENGALRKYLVELFGNNLFNDFTVFATNVVKCILEKKPTENPSVLDYLKPIFQNCKDYLIKEIDHFKPNFLFTLGGPAYQLFYSLLKNNNRPECYKFGNYFDGYLHDEKFVDHCFKYSPIPHINSYKKIMKGYNKENYYVKNKYYNTIITFKNIVKKELS
jgi:uracil-DNA glycosylase